MSAARRRLRLSRLGVRTGAERRYSVRLSRRGLTEPDSSDEVTYHVVEEHLCEATWPTSLPKVTCVKRAINARGLS